MPASVPALDTSPLAAGMLARARILYSDLDGTLLGIGGSVLVDGAGRPAADTAEAIVEVNRTGSPVVIVTGRNRAQSSEVSRVLGWRGFIAELGCVIVRDRGASPEFFLGDWPPGAVPEGTTPFEVMERAGALSALGEAFPGRIEQHDPYHLDREATHVLRGHIDLAEAARLLARLSPPVGIVDNGIIHPPRTTLVGVDEVHAYHLIPSGVTKHGAVARDLSERHLSPDDAIAIGDSATDVRMAESVGLMVLVGNGLEDERTMEAASAYDNVVAVAGARGSGWAELARAWVAARR